MLSLPLTPTGWLTLLGLLLGGWACAPSSSSVVFPAADKHRGAHVFGRLDSASVRALQPYHLEWVTLVPYASQQNINDTVRYQRNHDTRDRRRLARWAQRIETAHQAGYQVFLKPHIWLSNPAPGKWRSDIYPTDEAAWAAWQTSYRAFILTYAQLAADHRVAAFCVGTELTRLSTQRPAFWRTLIRDVRAIYPGRLTYAANWYGEYDRIVFWDALDFIGVQAYFPLTTEDHPTEAQLVSGWQPHLDQLRRVAERYGRPVLFTELGYKSTADGATRPWEWIDYEDTAVRTASDATQANAYRAFFRAVWPQPWLAGVHWWQLRSDFGDRARRWSPLDFTPQGKPAAGVLAREFAR